MKISLQRYLAIGLRALNIIAFLGIFAIFIVNFMQRDNIYQAHLSPIGYDVRGSKPFSFFYRFEIDAAKFKPLLCNNLASINIMGISLDDSIDSTKIRSLNHDGCEVFFYTQQDILENESIISYNIDFYPSIKILMLLIIFIFILQISITATANTFNKKYDYAIASLLTIFVVILCVSRIKIGHHWGGDFALYLSQAISIITNTTKELIADNTIMMDKIDVVKELYGPYAYPWGFPLILAVFYKIFGFDLFIFKLVCVMCYGIFVGLFYVFLSKRFKRSYAVFASLVFALNPTLLHFSIDSIGSDIPFLLISFAAIMAIGALFSNKHSCALAILGGFLMAYAAITRTNGLIIPIALFITHCFMLAFRWIKVPDSTASLKVQILPYISFIVVYLAALAYFPKEKANALLLHTKQLLGVNSIWENILYYSSEVGTFFNENHSIGVAIFAVCMPVILLGIIKSIKSVENIFYLLCILGYIALVLLYPDVGGLRYIFSVFPLLVYFFLNGFVYLGKYVKRCFFALFVIILLVFISFIVRFDGDKYFDGMVYSDYSMETWEFIRANTPQDAMILFYKPRILYLQTKRLGFTTAKLERLKEADFMLFYTYAYNSQNIDDSEFKKQTELLFENCDFKFYRILK